MATRNWKWLSVLAFAFTIIFLTACRDGKYSGRSEVDFEITDAPVDDSSVKGVFVTVADVKVNGQSIAGFSKTTIDLKAYQEGNTKLLGNATLDTKPITTLSLSLILIRMPAAMGRDVMSLRLMMQNIN